MEKQSKKQSGGFTTDYLWEIFDQWVMEQWNENLHVKSTAEQALHDNESHALHHGRACSLMPEAHYISPGQLARECSGPITITADAAPVLMRWLRLSLTLAQCRRREIQLQPFHSEALGDDAAVDWDDPKHVEAFGVLFEEMVGERGLLRQQWEASGLTLNDLIDSDLADEAGAFALTITN